MTPQELHKCLVCGEETKNRCSACQKAGIDLFFCSTEHQKLVWFAHMLVCGPGKANPFTWPLLTTAEAEDAIAHKATPTPGHGLNLMQIFEVPSDALNRMLRELADPAGRRQPWSFEQMVIGVVRMQAAARRYRGNRNPSSVDLLSGSRQTDVLHIASQWAARIDTKLIEDPTPVHTRTMLLHRVVVAFALLRSGYGEPANPAAEPFVVGALERVADAIEVDCTPYNPTQAADAVAALRHFGVGVARADLVET
ncbi:hypothetical protein JCM10450v2_003478 [Rhodotorula kratochvilovae]